MNSEQLNVYQAAKMLNVTSQWVRVLLAEQRLPGAHKVDGVWKIPVEALQQHREAVSA